MSDFYELSICYSPSTIQVHSQGLNSQYSTSPNPNERRIFDQDKLLIGDYSKIKFPVVFKQERGRHLKDMLGTGHPSLYLISDKMKSELKINFMTGWNTFPVELLDRDDRRIDGYYGLSITGRSGPIDYSKSKIIEKRLVPNGPLTKYYRGCYIGVDKWDGSDFFIPEATLAIFVTTRVAETINRAKLTNVEFRNLTEIEIDAFTVQVELKNRMLDIDNK